MVTWEVTPADSNTFVVNSGQAVFENGQETADIEIEVSSKCTHRHTCVHRVHACVGVCPSLHGVWSRERERKSNGVLSMPAWEGD